MESTTVSFSVDAMPSTPVRRGRRGRSGLPAGQLSPPSVLAADFSFGPLYAPGEKWVGSLLEEYGPPATQTTVTWSTSYEVVQVAGRGTHLFVVLGRARDGELSVLERWDLTQPTGAPTVTLDQTSVVVGVSVATSPATPGFQGGTWIAPSERTAPAQPARTECYRGPLLGEDLALEVDPDGRFALVLARDQGKLYRVLLEEDAEPVVVLDDTAVPALAHVNGLQTFRHATWGRQVSGFIDAPGLARLILFDYDNDAVFDQVEAVSLATLNAMNLPADWVEDYTNYSGLFAPYDW